MKRFQLIFGLLVCAFAIAMLFGCTAISCLRHRHGGDEPVDCNPPEPLQTFHLGTEEVPVWRYGETGPPVLLLHELPGMSRECIRLARMIAARGYRVYVPKLFGGYSASAAGIGRILHICRNGEFDCCSVDNPNAPLVKFIRTSLFPLMRADGDRTVIIGMCLTGSVGAELFDDDFVAGAIMSQPAMPFPISARRRESLGMTASEVAAAKQRGTPILAFRFTKDCLSPPERMANFVRTFGKQINVFQIDSARCNQAGFPETAHAVLTQFLRLGEPDDPTNRALQMTFDFLDARLKTTR
jgi:dienelactone hydrolase